MSMYNALHGFNSNAAVCLSVIERGPDDFGRFRDAWLNEDGTKIIVLSRMGGGNRCDWNDTIEEIRRHEDFIEDYDDTWDETFMHHVFGVPEAWLQVTTALATGIPEPSLKEKTDAAIRDLNREGSRSHAFGKNLTETLLDVAHGGAVFISPDGILRVEEGK